MQVVGMAERGGFEPPVPLLGADTISSFHHHFGCKEELMADEKVLSLRLPAPLHKKIAALAEKDFRSLNAEIVYLLTKAVEGEK